MQRQALQALIAHARARLFSLDELGALCVAERAALRGRVRVVGQTADGALLVTWQQADAAADASAVATYVGFYGAGALSRCYRAERALTIVSCSATADRVR